MDLPSLINPDSLESALCDSIDRICRDAFPKYRDPTLSNTIPAQLREDLKAAGVFGLPIEERFGGSAADAVLLSAVLETIAAVELGPAVFASVHWMVSGLIQRFGSDQQKASLLPAMARGEILGAFALTEPHAGSDARAIQTRFEARDGEYILNGGKCYITSAGFAELYIVFARGSDSEVSAFLIASTAPGLEVGPPEKKMGCELSPIASLFLNDTRVPESALLGPLGGGYRAALSGLSGGRVNIAACANGLAREAIRLSIAHLKERRQFGQPLAEFQALRFMVADMYMAAESARLITRRGAELIASGADARIIRTSASSAKCAATDAAMKITTDAVQLLGGAGYIADHTVERLMRGAKMLQIVEGTNQIQRTVLAKELLDD
jgi:alkylation response protein AidB-like acyl-CoA dehydrogenase